MLREKIMGLKAAEREEIAKKERFKKEYVRKRPIHIHQIFAMGKRSGTRKASKDDNENHLKEVQNDEGKGLVLGELAGFSQSKSQRWGSNTERDVQDAVENARSGSPPGLGGIPNKV